MSHENPNRAYLSLRLSHALAAALKRAADIESNTQSAVARRLISAGLSRELRADEQDSSDKSR